MAAQPPDPGPRRWWLAPMLAAIGLLVGLAAGLGIGYAGGAFGSDSDTDFGGEGSRAERNARLACESLAWWGGPEAVARVEEEGIPGTWLGYTVYGFAHEAAEHDERYRELADAGMAIVSGLTRMNVDTLAEGVADAGRQCDELGF